MSSYSFYRTKALQNLSLAVDDSVKDILEMEPAKVNPCPECKVSYASAGSLRTHMLKKHKYTKIVFRCHICKNTFEEVRQLTRHLKSHEKD